MILFGLPPAEQAERPPGTWAPITMPSGDVFEIEIRPGGPDTASYVVNWRGVRSVTTRNLGHPGAPGVPVPFSRAGLETLCGSFQAVAEQVLEAVDRANAEIVGG